MLTGRGNQMPPSLSTPWAIFFGPRWLFTGRKLERPGCSEYIATARRRLCHKALLVLRDVAYFPKTDGEAYAATRLVPLRCGRRGRVFSHIPRQRPTTEALLPGDLRHL